MTTLEQISCTNCGETFHKPTMSPLKIVASANFDYRKTCPKCGHENIKSTDKSMLKNRVRITLRPRPEYLKKVLAAMRAETNSIYDEVRRRLEQ